MKQTILTAMAACMALAGITTTGARAQSTETYPSYVEVTGYAEKEVTPDVFYMRVEINEVDSKGKNSLEQQQKSMLSSLKALGVDTDRQLTRLSLSSSFYNRKTNLSSAVYQLKLGSAETVSKVWRKLDDLGISNVSFTKAEYSRIEEFKDEVRREAVRNARQQASSMAEAIGQKIGKCFYMYCGHSGSPVVYAQARMVKGLAMNAADTVEESGDGIEFNNIKVSISVSSKFVLE